MLTKNQKQEYDENGFVAPLDLLSQKMINDFLSELEYAQQKWPDMLKGTGRNNPHLVFPSLDKILSWQKTTIVENSNIVENNNFLFIL